MFSEILENTGVLKFEKTHKFYVGEQIFLISKAQTANNRFEKGEAGTVVRVTEDTQVVEVEFSGKRRLVTRNCSKLGF